MDWLYLLLAVTVLGVFAWSWSKMPQIMQEWSASKNMQNDTEKER